MPRIFKSLALAFAALLLVAPVARAQGADPAAQTIQSFYDTLLDSMKNAKTLGAKGRYDKLKPAVEAAFDIKTMTGISVGQSVWAGLSAADKKSLTDSFERLTIAGYAGGFDGYSGEKFTVEPKATARGNDQVVKSQLMTGDGKTIPFYYQMRQSGGTWKIIDVVLNGEASQLAIYNADFSSTMRTSGAQGLAKKINEMADKKLQ